MELGLSRVDYALTGLTMPHTMQLLPNTDPKLAQKVAVGDQDGILQVFSMKKGEQQLSFKTLPGPAISRVALGGAIGTLKDKVFISKGGEVRGYTKKGKLFLSFDSNLTEPIRSMHVSGSTLLLAGQYAYNQYRDCQDCGSYVCSDVINDVTSLPIEKTNTLVPVLACGDARVRVLEGSAVRDELRIPSVPTVLYPAANEGGDMGRLLLFGTDDGRVGVVNVARGALEWQWILDEERPGSAVSALHCYDLCGDGELDLIVGRQDGTIEVYATSGLPEGLDNFGSREKPAKRYSYTCSESITGAQGGVFGNNGYDEIVVSTYTGWLFGLTTETADKAVGVENNEAGSFRISQEARSKLSSLKAELEALEERVAKERERYLEAAEDGSTALSAIPYLNIKDKLTLVREDASYLLSLEAATAIDNVLVQADVSVDILDVDRNSAVVSFSACDPEGANRELVTFRCQLNTTRLELRLRTIEGQSGCLRVYVTPLVAPKCAALRLYRIPPLSLHARAHDADPDRPYSTLTLKGPFSLPEMHSWIRNCLPEVADKPPGAAGDKASLVFQSACMGTMLICTYAKGEAEFRSDNISTISILKDALTKQATEKKIHLDISCVSNPESACHAVRLMFPLLRDQVCLNRDVALLDALKELDKECLAPKYLAILEQEDTLRAKHRKHPAYLDRLCGMLTDLYIDKFKFRGVNVKNKVPRLLEIVDTAPLDSLLEQLLELFEQSHTN